MPLRTLILTLLWGAVAWLALILVVACSVAVAR
jgi:RsiW-degrading membrane proteinase PrsW (M82 family)